MRSGRRRSGGAVSGRASASSLRRADSGGSRGTATARGEAARDARRGSGLLSWPGAARRRSCRAVVTSQSGERPVAGHAEVRFVNAVAVPVAWTTPRSKPLAPLTSKPARYSDPAMLDRADDVWPPVADPWRAHRLEPPRERRVEVGRIPLNQDVTDAPAAQPVCFQGALQPEDRLSFARGPEGRCTAIAR